MLIYDNREKDYIVDLLPKYIDENNEKYKNYRVDAYAQQLTRGDYAISIDGVNINIIIERKTWKDLATSLGGRFEKQRDELLSVSDVCKVFYIIEGGTKYNPETNVLKSKAKNYYSKKYNSKIPRITYKQLEGTLRELLLLGIPYIITENAEHTARFLVKLTRDVVKTKYERIGELKNIFGGNLNYVDMAEKIYKIGGTAHTEKLETTHAMEKVNAWAALKGVGPKSATALAAAEIPLIDLILKRENIEQRIAESTYSNTGRKVGVKTAEKIMNNFDLARLLTGINGVSKKRAIYISKSIDFSDAENLEKNIAELKINSRRLGKKIAKRIAETILL